jgi:hypothetical protein
MILNLFFLKNGPFFARSKAKLCINLIIKVISEKNANFFSKNCRKSQKIKIINLANEYPPDIFRKNMCLHLCIITDLLNQSDRSQKGGQNFPFSYINKVILELTGSDSLTV